MQSQRNIQKSNHKDIKAAKQREIQAAKHRDIQAAKHPRKQPTIQANKLHTSTSEELNLTAADENSKPNLAHLLLYNRHAVAMIVPLASAIVRQVALTTPTARAADATDAADSKSLYRRLICLGKELSLNL